MIMIILALLTIPFFGVWGLLEIKNLILKKYTISSPYIPESLDGKKLALISDQHGIMHGEDNQKVFDLLKKAGPDYIVIAGDMINGRNYQELKYVSRFLGRLKSFNVPVIYTFGNHEEKMGKYHPELYRKLKRIARRKSIRLNNCAYSPEGIPELLFTGINLPLEMYHAEDDGLIEKRSARIIRRYDKAKYGKAYKGERYRILIAHDPEHIEKYAKCGYNLCLSGHLHGGIIRLPFLGGLITPRFKIFHRPTKGLVEYGNTTMIISGGVGWHDIPFRLFNRPEIPVIEFKKCERKSSAR